ncbi:hypothetical protein [Roseicyclus mahoneyensis]|uniref:Uncharacterized protein n=1 Tax=Roseicyclus mahoneyensis TaxID=164332 RepID=A0A316GJD0_9RHOB|nr:hypothetical protein [Roseicyclus mahoneyensis]PWK60367.1 hypothetical protein C7455_1043 [Roseicyclus mahoneyensis]
MPVVTVRAADSATAMDEIIRRLGPDAMILSTRARDGQVEIMASDEAAPMPARAPRPELPADPHVDASPQANVPEPEAFTVPGWAAGFAAHLAQAIGTPSGLVATPDPAAPVATVPPGPPIGIAPVAAAILAAPRVVLVGPLGAGKSALALQIAEARLAAQPDGDSAVPGFVFCGTGSQCDGAYLSQKAWLLGAEMGFAAAETLLVATPDAPQIVVVSDLHPDPVAAARALMALDGAVCLLVLPAGLTAARVAGHGARWDGIASGAVLTLAPSDTALSEDADALAQSGLTHVWTSRRGKLIDGLVPPAEAMAPAEAPWSSGRVKTTADAGRLAHPTARPEGLHPFHPHTLTNPAAG